MAVCCVNYSGLGTVIAAFIGVAVVVAYAFTLTYAPYITVDSLDLQFTEREYHKRVRGQIEEHGFQHMCMTHLLSLDPAAKTYDVNRARQNLVLVTECAEAQNNE